jgi:hypothetical protein
MATCAYAEWPRIRPSLKNRQVSIRTAIVLPVLVDYKQEKFFRGHEGGVKSGNEVAGKLYASIVRELIRRGVDVAPSPSETANTDTDRFALADVQTRYDTTALQFRKRPGLVEESRATLGDVVAKFASASGRDAIVFARVFAQRNLIGGAYHLELSFVDAKAGDVLAFLRLDFFHDAKMRTESGLDEDVSDLLTHVPLPVKPHRH